MAFHIRDLETDTLVRKLARKNKIGLTEAVKLAVTNELERNDSQVPLRDRLRMIADEIAKYPKTGKKADKKFFDDLSGC
jgi:antitoxin VapB